MYVVISLSQVVRRLKYRRQNWLDFCHFLILNELTWKLCSSHMNINVHWSETEMCEMLQIGDVIILMPLLQTAKCKWHVSVVAVQITHLTWTRSDYSHPVFHLMIQTKKKKVCFSIFLDRSQQYKTLFLCKDSIWTTLSLNDDIL